MFLGLQQAYAKYYYSFGKQRSRGRPQPYELNKSYPKKCLVPGILNISLEPEVERYHITITYEISVYENFVNISLRTNRHLIIFSTSSLDLVKQNQGNHIPQIPKLMKDQYFNIILKGRSRESMGLVLVTRHISLETTELNMQAIRQITLAC